MVWSPYGAAPWEVLQLVVKALEVQERPNVMPHARFAPQENLRSSWDFLGNKAHSVNGTVPKFLEKQAHSGTEDAELVC